MGKGILIVVLYLCTYICSWAQHWSDEINYYCSSSKYKWGGREYDEGKQYLKMGQYHPRKRIFIKPVENDCPPLIFKASPSCKLMYIERLADSSTGATGWHGRSSGKYSYDPQKVTYQINVCNTSGTILNTVPIYETYYSLVAGNEGRFLGENYIQLCQVGRNLPQYFDMFIDLKRNSIYAFHYDGREGPMTAVPSPDDEHLLYYICDGIDSATVLWLDGVQIYPYRTTDRLDPSLSPEQYQSIKDAQADWLARNPGHYALAPIYEDSSPWSPDGRRFAVVKYPDPRPNAEQSAATTRTTELLVFDAEAIEAGRPLDRYLTHHTLETPNWRPGKPLVRWSKDSDRVAILNPHDKSRRFRLDLSEKAELPNNGN